MKKSEVFTGEASSFEDTMLNDLATRVRSTRYGSVNIFMYATKHDVTSEDVYKFLGSDLEALVASIVDIKEPKSRFIWLNNGKCIPMINVQYVKDVLQISVEQFLTRFVSNIVSVCEAMPQFKERDILLTDVIGSAEWACLESRVKDSIINSPEHVQLLKELRLGVELNIPKNNKVKCGKITYYVTENELVITKPVKKTFSISDLQ